MTTRNNLLDRLEITSPCRANWDKMAGTDQVRFCSECNRYVYNLSSMTQNEAESLVASQRGRMCARMIRDLDGNTLTVDSSPPVRLLRWRPGPLVGAVVSAMITIVPGTATLAHVGRACSQPGYSQGVSGGKQPRLTSGSMTSTITGRVVDQNGLALPGAVVTLIGEASGEVLSQITSEDGEFRFEGLPVRSYIVEIQSRGFKSLKYHDVQLHSDEVRRLDATLYKEVATMGGFAITAQPLRALYLESDRVVVATVGKNIDETGGSTSLVRTSLIVDRTIKGDGHKPAIDVYNWVYGRHDPSALNEGESVLAFLQRNDATGAAGSKDGYRLVFGLGGSVKKLQGEPLETYVQRLEELKAITSDSKTNSGSITNWLVRCAENPVTRWEGAFELENSAKREEWERQAAKETGGSLSVDRITSLVAGASDSSCKKPPEREPLFSSLLTEAQKERLLNVILKSENFVDGDLELIELAKHWNDARLPPFLISYLERGEKAPLQFVAGVMEVLAELLDDEELRGLLCQYRNNVSNIEAKDESEENDAEPSDEEKAQGEDQANASSDEPESEPKLTPQEAKAVRTATLKRFVETAEAKIKQPAAQRQTCSANRVRYPATVGRLLSSQPSK